jgi:hypothetical protein
MAEKFLRAFGFVTGMLVTPAMGIDVRKGDTEKDGYLQKGLRGPAKSSDKVCKVSVSFSLSCPSTSTLGWNVESLCSGRCLLLLLLAIRSHGLVGPVLFSLTERDSAASLESYDESAELSCQECQALGKKESQQHVCRCRRIYS